MSFTEAQPSPDVFEGGGVQIAYDRTQCLPPDMAGVAMGAEAAQVVKYVRIGEPEVAVSVLELGTGSGVCLTSLLRRVESQKDVQVTGLDISPDAVDATLHNLAGVTRSEESPTVDVFVGDWYDEYVWAKLSERRYDAIMCNPPYLAPGTPLMDGYETVPHSAVYAEGDGLGHHRFLMPRLLGLLSVRQGATLITRFHSTFNNAHDESRAIDKVVCEAVEASPPISDLSIVRRHLALVGPGRNMATVSISRSDTVAPPHLYV